MNKLILLVTTFILFGCAEQPRKNINWNDRRCVTVHDVWVNRKSQEKSGANIFMHTITSNYLEAHKIATGGNKFWTEGFTGDGKMVMVGYNESGEITSIKDMDGQEISLDDFDRLGPFVTKYDYSAKELPAFQLATELGTLRIKYGKGIESFRASKRPLECDLSK